MLAGEVARGVIVEKGARYLENNPIILLHPVRKPIDQTARGALFMCWRSAVPSSMTGLLSVPSERAA
jgi:hypothetical protein